jgi:hypothetical protein
MDTQEKSKKKFYKKWWFWIIVILILLWLIGSNGSASPTKSVPATSDNPSTSPTAVQAKTEPSAPQTLLNISGSGSKTTAKFTAASDWDLNWSYDCSNFNNQGNFQVMIYNGDGSMSFSNAMVNELGASGSDVEHYHSSGTYYLVVNSECKWKLNVQG